MVRATGRDGRKKKKVSERARNGRSQLFWPAFDFVSCFDFFSFFSFFVYTRLLFRARLKCTLLFFPAPSFPLNQ